MWKDSLVVPFRRRSESISAPLIPSSTATFTDSVRGREDDNEQARHGRSSESTTVTANQSPPSVSTENPTSPFVSIGSESRPFEERRDIEWNRPSSWVRRIKSFLMEELDTARATAPLTAYCFMTGFMSAVSFSAVYVWCAFQTGNTIQLSIALARLFNGQHDSSFHVADQQALCSLLSFLLGTSLGRVGDKIGSKTRAWLMAGTFVQTLFTTLAAVVIWKSRSSGAGDARGEPAWTDALSFVALGCMSASMGLQGIMAKRLNTQFSTTVVLTATWCELATEPGLLDLRRLVPSRDHKAVAILSLFFGGFVGSALSNAIGDAGALGVGTGLRLLLTLWWLLVPAERAKTALLI